MKSFEDFLKEIHARNYTGTDDDMSETFEDWLSELDGEEYMRYAEFYGQLVYINGQQEGLKMAKVIIKG